MVATTVRRTSGVRRRRFGVVSALAGLLSAVGLAVTQAPASAGAWVTCPAGLTGWKVVHGSRGGQIWEGYRYTLHSAVPTFLVSDGQLLDNSGTDLSVSYTITSSVSRTYSVTATVGVQTQPTQWLTTSVNTSIVSSVTTARGVSISTTVPPRTRLLAEYGVEAYQVSYAIEAYRTERIAGNKQPPGPNNRCEEWGYYPQNAIAPTHVEGWRLRTT
ncbi:hypothetical protein O7627_12040 [Solwaraspora sp. WMMD1047]|uniref:hypothetical protein n=1 Tax=Solwaraspora sp. WMMD1047 TaxID=3016102 RepID=UPI0024163955|nr:hypothetical protein [Solwaraspora sp. WMMD1047]MDG4830028.1 hypothetical protein [Solwaraspora sp. WMMD1047]